jgi:hypothetical protein
VRGQGVTPRYRRRGPHTVVVSSELVVVSSELVVVSSELTVVVSSELKSGV